MSYIEAWLRQRIEFPSEFIEPFAGGGSVSLAVAFQNLAERVTMVELDSDVAAVWETIINDDGGAQWLADRIVAFDLTDESLDTLFAAHDDGKRQTAFQTIVRNRINRGGILTKRAGRLRNGEKRADGTTKGLHSRWYADTLKQRIVDIGRIRSHIEFIQGDGMEVLAQCADREGALFFIDPPYITGGRQLYTQFALNHEKLFQLTATLIGDFLMTYDDDPQVRVLAAKHRFDLQAVTVRTTHHLDKGELLIGRDLRWLRALLPSAPDSPNGAIRTGDHSDTVGESSDKRHQPAGGAEIL